MMIDIPEPEPHAHCRSYLEDFTIEQRAVNCPFCLKRGVACEGNFHKSRGQPQAGKVNEIIPTDTFIFSNFFLYRLCMKQQVNIDFQ